MTTTDFDTKHPRAAHSGRFVPTDHARRDAGQVDAFSEPRRSFVSRPAPRFDVLREVDGVSFTFFEARDVVRHPLVARIVNAYDRRDLQQVKPGANE